MATPATTEHLAGTTVPLPFRVMTRRRETADTWTLRLEPVGGEPLAWRPGQFTMLSTFWGGEVPISISGDPGKRGVLVHTVRAVGAATRSICASGAGDVLGVRGAFGNAWPVEEAEGGDLVIVAGGIGLAPLRGALLGALRARRRYGRVLLLYGGRTPVDLLYRPELAKLRLRPDLYVAITVDAAGPGWTDQVGVAGALVARAPFDPGSTTALLCGPEVMMRYTALALLDRGVAAERVFVSMERNMRCGVGHCGHCQLGPTLVCRDGPVYTWAEASELVREPER